MKVKYSFVCDSANMSQSGTLNVLGIFSNINIREFPHVHPKMTYIAYIEFHRSEVGVHKFKLLFVNDDGKDVLPPLTGEINVSPEGLNTHIILDIANVMFGNAGTYAIDLTINNQNMSSDSILVSKI